MNDDEHVDNDETGIAARYRAVRARADAAALGAGRNPGDVKIIGVTKLKPAAMIRHAATAGITDVGENYVQELAAKHEELGDIVRWHFIGSLQRNKARSIAPFVALVHSVDSERLGAELDRQAAAHGRRIPVLLEVNTSNEQSKAGVAPDEALELARALARLGNIELRGMMTIAAFLDDAELVRPMFRVLRELRDHTAATLGIELPHLSMGMTNDFEVAIAEGATMVRIGTAIFGRR